MNFPVGSVGYNLTQMRGVWHDHLELFELDGAPSTVIRSEAKQPPMFGMSLRIWSPGILNALSRGFMARCLTRNKWKIPSNPLASIRRVDKIARHRGNGSSPSICEQTETAGKDIKLVKREVVRVITPGTAIDPQLLEAKESIYLASVSGSGETFGLSFLELSTGEFFASEFSGKNSFNIIL